MAAPDSADRRENVQLRELVAAYSHLSGLASQDGDVGGVVRLVAHRTRCRVVVLGSDLGVIAAVPAGAGERLGVEVGEERLTAVLAVAAQNRRAVSLSPAGPGEAGIVVAPVLVGDDVAAHLVTVAVGGQELDADLLLLLTEHAATVCGIILGRERVVAAAAGRARTDLVEGLLLARDRDDGEAERWAGHLGFARGAEHHVLAVGVAESADRARVLAVAEHTITRARAAAIVTVREGEVVAVVPVEGPDSVRELAQRCRRSVGERHPEAAVVAGIGGPCREAREIARSYAEARSAIDAARRMAHAPGVVAYEELGVLRLLLQVPDAAELHAFAVDVLGDLVRDRGGTDLLGTLAAWFRCNGSPQRAARELHVHPNTVTYRIRRAEEIAGLRLDHHRDRLMAQLACEIVQALP